MANGTAVPSAEQFQKISGSALRDKLEQLFDLIFDIDPTGLSPDDATRLTEARLIIEKLA